VSEPVEQFLDARLVLKARVIRAYPDLHDLI
jgi:hypothetical protein